MLHLNPKNKLAGVLAPLFALRGSTDLGVGDTQALGELVDWSVEVGLGVIQMLPINEMDSDHSPYNILSSIAIEPSTITTTPEFLPDLDPRDFASITAKFDLPRLRANEIHYSEVKALKLELLRAAFDRLDSPTRIQAFKNFCEEHREWLKPYSLFRSLHHIYGADEFSKNWQEIGYSSAEKHIVHLQREINASLERIQNFYSYVQWVAFSQWQRARQYAESRKIALIGDIPIGVSPASVDVWTDPQLFDRTRSSGAPPEPIFGPDPFTKKWGQNWGFPLYNWQEMLKDDCHWWRRRLRIFRRIFHFLRLDHVLGFFRIYSFPWHPTENERFTLLSENETQILTGGLLPQFVERDDKTEENRRKNRLQGEKLLRIFLKETGPYRLIAEDLGQVPPYVRPCLAALEIPGLKIALWEKIDERTLTPGANYPRISLATYTTHDSPPLRVLWERWIQEIRSGDASRAEAALTHMHALLDFANYSHLPVPQYLTKDVHLALLRGLFACNSWLAILPITDIIDTKHQFNVPGTAPALNWKVRLELPVALLNTEKKALICEVQKILKTTCRKIL